MSNAEVIAKAIPVLENAKRLYKKKSDLYKAGLNDKQYADVLKAALLDFEDYLPDVQLNFDEDYFRIINYYFEDGISAESVINILLGDAVLYAAFKAINGDFEQLLRDKSELRINNGWIK